MIHARPSALLALVLLLAAATLLQAQSRVYLLPDIGTPGRNTYCEIVAQVGGGTTSFPVGDGIATVTAIRVEPSNPADTNRIIVSPVVISWASRQLAFQIFVKRNAALGPVPLRIRYPNNPTAIPPAVDTFFIVAPTSIGTRTGGGVLGSGGTWGRRSKRGAMIVDSLILSSGTYTVETAYDTDPYNTGNQGYLPVTIISLGRVVLSSATLGVNASGKDGGPGGGGGGGYGPSRTGSGPVPGERDADAEKAAGRPPLGSGFVGGYSNVPIVPSPGPFGVGSGGPGVTPGNPAQSQSLNGVTANVTFSNNRLYAGGAGHPFDEDGRSGGAAAVGVPPAVFGFYQGAGGNATAGSGLPAAAPNAVNGQVIGNAMIVPLHGGAGGASGGSYDSVGGGGGGGISIHAWLDAQITTAESNGGAGRNGFSGPAGSGDPSGGGSGGCVLIGAKLLSRLNTVNVAGGIGGTRVAPSNANSSAGTGGAGRFRLDGRIQGGPPTLTMSASNFVGPTIDTITFADSVNWRLRGTGRPFDSVIIFVRGDEFSWNNYPTYTVRVSADSTWATTIQFPYDSVAYLFALQKIDTTGGTRPTTKPAYIFSQSAAAVVRLRLIARMVAPTIRNLDTIRCGGDFIDTFTVNNTGTGLLILKSGSGLTGGAASRYTLSSPGAFPDTIFPGQRRVIRLIVPANAPEGDLSTTLRLQTTDPNAPTHDIVIRLHKETERHTVGPRRIDMGGVQYGGFADTVLTFVNHNTYADTIIGVDRVFGPANVAYRSPALPARVPGGDTVRLRLRFSPTDTLRTTTRFVVRVLPCNRIDTIEITGYGVTGIVDSKKRLDFLSIACGDTAVDSVWIKNTGNTNLTLHAPTIIDVDAPRYTILSPSAADYPKVLRPFVDSFLVKVRVVAQGTGVLLAQLRFENSDSIRLPRPHNPWLIDLKVEPDRARLTLQDTVVELGTVCVGGMVERSVRMSNPSLNSPIALRQFQRRANVPSISITPSTLLVGAGAQEDINFRFRPTVAGEFYDTLDIITGPCDEYFRVVVHGTALDASIVPSPTSHDFGDVPGGSPAQKSIYLRNRGTSAPIEISGLAITPANSQVRIVSATVPPVISIPPGDSLEVVVEYAPAGAAALPTIALQAVTTSPCIDTISIPLAGRPLRGDIGVNPTSLSFRSSPCNGGDVDRIVSIFNVGTTVVSVQAPSAAPSVFTVVSPTTAFTLQPGDTQTIQVRYSPGAVGTIAGTLTLNTSDANRPTIQVNLTGTRDTALIQPLVQVINFGQLPWCQRGDTIYLTLKNSGSVTDTVVQLNIPAPFEAFPPPPYILAPGDTSDVRIIFSPTIPGVYSDFLTYRTATCDQEFSVRLDGEKVDSVFAVDPVDFGDVTVATNGTFNATVTNGTTQAVRVTGARIIPPHPDVTVTSSFPMTIGAMGSAQVRLQFSPQSPGILPAGTMLLVDLDSICTTTLSTTVTGRGIQGGVAFSRGINPGTVHSCLDSLDTVSMKNVGLFPVTLQLPTVSPAASAASFTLVNTADFPVTLAPDDSTEVIVRFTPSAGAAGPVTGTLDFPTDDPAAPVASLSLNGVRGVQSLAVGGVGIAPTGAGFTGTGYHWLYNTGNLPITVDNVTVGGPFRVTGTLPGGSVTLQPGDSMRVDLEFIPPTPGTWTDSLTVVTATSPCGLNAPSITAEAIDLSTVTAQGQWADMQGAPGDIVRIPLQISTDMGQFDVREYTASIHFNPTVLVPLAIRLDNTIVPGWQVTSTRFDRGSARFTASGTQPLDSTGVIAWLEALVALGDSTVSTLAPGDTFQLVAPRAAFRVAAGQFTLLDNCVVGGERRITFGEGLKITAVRPDPVRGEAEIEFSTIESGSTSLRLYDALGRLVEVLVEENLDPRTHVVSFRVGTLPSGLYHLELRSPTERHRRTVMIGE